MIVQDVIALPTFNQHGGPVTHSSTWSKLDSPMHPYFNSHSWRVASYVIHELPFERSLILVSYAILILLLWTPFTLYFRYRTIAYPFETFVAPIMLSRCFMQTTRETLYASSPELIVRCSILLKPVLTEFPLSSFRKYGEDPEERTMTSSWFPDAAKWRHQRKGSTSSRRATKTEKTR